MPWWLRCAACTVCQVCAQCTCWVLQSLLTVSRGVLLGWLSACSKLCISDTVDGREKLCSALRHITVTAQSCSHKDRIVIASLADAAALQLLRSRLKGGWQLRRERPQLLRDAGPFDAYVLALLRKATH
jgi:hypothetical protein